MRISFYADDAECTELFTLEVGHVTLFEHNKLTLYVCVVEPCYDFIVFLLKHDIKFTSQRGRINIHNLNVLPFKIRMDNSHVG
jgi:hypothetical protein